MSKLVEGYFHLLKLLIATCLVLMVVLVFGNVVLRYVFNQGITLSEELSRWLFVYLTFLGAIVAVREHGLLGVDTVVKRLPPAGRRVCLVLSQVLMLCAVVLLLRGSWVQTRINLDTTAPASGLSMGIFYGVGIVFGVSVGLILLVELYRTLTRQVRDEDLVMVKESEDQAEFEELQKELAERERHGLAAAHKR